MKAVYRPESIAKSCKRIHPFEIPKIHCKGKLEFENHSDIDMCYGRQTVLQYANSGIRSEAEIEEKRKASQLARLIISCSMA